MKYIFNFCSAFTLIVGLSGCNNADNSQSPQNNGTLSVSLSPSTVVLGKTSKLTINTSQNSSNATAGQKINITSSNPSVATLSNSSCTLVQSGQGYSCSITVFGKTMGSSTLSISGTNYSTITNIIIIKENNSLIWTKQLGAKPPQGFTEGLGVASDTNGDAYLAGYTQVGLNGQTQNGSYDSFVSKYDSNSNILWTRQLGANGGVTTGRGVAVDTNGDAYLVGNTKVGLNGQTQNGSYDSFVSKYDISGNLLWTKQLGASGGDTEGMGVTVDTNGNTYVAGYTSVGLDGQSQFGKNDYFVSKYDIYSNLLWTKQLGANSGDTEGRGIGVDTNGNSYVAGFTNVGLNGQKQNGTNDFFVSKYDSNGNLIWTKQLGVKGGQTLGYAIGVDSSGNSYVAGQTQVSLNGQPMNGIGDSFISKYDTNGNLLWTKQLGGSGGVTIAFGIAVESNGNSYISGSTNVGLNGQTENGTRDYFVSYYDTNGNLLWTKQLGITGGFTRSFGVGVDSNGNSFVAGTTNAGLNGQVQNGGLDAFISKYGALTK